LLRRDGAIGGAAGGRFIELGDLLLDDRDELERWAAMAEPLRLQTRPQDRQNPDDETPSSAFLGK